MKNSNGRTPVVYAVMALALSVAPSAGYAQVAPSQGKGVATQQGQAWPELQHDKAKKRGLNVWIP